MIGLVSMTLLLSVSTGPAEAAYPWNFQPYCGAKVYKENGQAWRCTFADEFSGSTLNSKYWSAMTTASTKLRGNGDCWVNSPNNIRVTNGVLRLTTRREAAPFTCTTGYNPQVTSGSVSTYGKFSQTFGRWDIRARFPQITVPGSQSALWMTPARNLYGAWPASGEIDIAEFFSTYPDRAIPYVHYLLGSLDKTVTNNYCMVTNPWEFHLYSLVWTNGRIVVSIDGTTCVDHKINPALPLLGSQPFDKPFVINLTQTVGVGTNSLADATPLPLTTEIDYVHVWS